MVDAWTGVILPKPMEAIASKIHSANGGVRASQALGSFFGGSGPMVLSVAVFSGEMLEYKIPVELIDKKAACICTLVPY